MEYNEILKKKELFEQKMKTEDPEKIERFMHDFAIEFTHHSTAIEGNSLSLEETKAIIENDGGIGINELKHLIRHHNDPVTVPEIIMEIYQEYKEIGYEVTEPFLNAFTYLLADGTKIQVYWEKGAFYEEALLS